MKVFSYGEFQTSTETEPGVIVTHAVLASSARGRRRTHLRILSPAHPQDILKQIDQHPSFFASYNQVS